MASKAIDLEVSHLEYVNKRNVTYNKKYTIIEHIVKDWKDGCSIVELFGGVGITTFFIRKHVKPKLHTILDINKDCISELKAKYPDADIRLQSAHDFDEFEKYDYVLFDPVEFSLPKIKELRFDCIFERMVGDKPHTMILTDLGFFVFTFIKREKWDSELKKFVDRYNSVFSQYGFYINRLFYANEFSQIEFMKGERTPELIYWTTSSPKWRQALLKGTLWG